MNQFKLTPEEERRRIIDAFETTLASRGSGAAKVVSVRPFAAQSSTPMLIAEVVYGKETTKESWVIKPTSFGLNAPQDAMRCAAAHYNATLHSLKHYGYYIQQYSDVWYGAGDVAKQRKAEVIHPPYYVPGQIAFDAQLLRPNSTTLFDHFRDMRKRTSLCKKDEAVIDQLSESLQRIHRHRTIPVSMPDVDTVSLDDEKYFNGERRNEAYNGALSDVLCQYEYYRGSSPTHPVLTPRREHELVTLVRELVRRWHNRGDRLVISLGDLHAMNVLTELREGKVIIYFIDPHHRCTFFDAAYDVGRLRFDCVEWSIVTGNPIYLEWGDRFLHVHGERTDDAEIGPASMIGTLSRLFWKLCTRNTGNMIHVEEGLALQAQFDAGHGLDLYRWLVPRFKAGEFMLQAVV